ncbi:MAG: hypothetical protein IJD09_01970 [Clostridia bacterium]|nr:hypothetical protein [Clostridia bacterium]
MHYHTFCAANSGDGFISFFDTLTDEENSNVYYIKGGPGSGKSTLLKRVAKLAKNAELIYCSGDPSSLDAVVLPDQNTVIFDATNPHSYEPKFPAVGGNIIDLGEGWDPSKMNKMRILEINKQKSNVYKSCYSLLKSAKEIHAAIFEPILYHTQKERMLVATDRLLKQLSLWENNNKPATVTKRFLSAISPNGRHTFTDTIRKLCKKIVVIEDRWMISHMLLAHIDQVLSSRGIDHINSYHPLLGREVLHHILIPCADIAFVTKDGLFTLDLDDEEIYKKIVIQSYIEKDYLNDRKNKLTFIKRMMKEHLNLSCEKLYEARSLHMELESEYAKGTDFSKTDHLKENLISKLFG